MGKGGGVEAVAAEAEVEEKGGKQGDEAVAPPPPHTEVGTSNRIATRPRGAEQRQKQRRKRRTMRKGKGTEILQGGHRQRWSMWGGACLPLEEFADLPDFNPERAHLLLWGVYGDCLHHNNGSHLYRVVEENAIW